MESPKTLSLVNPATTLQYQMCGVATAAQVDAAAQAAAAAFPSWSETPGADRADFLRKMADEIEARKEQLAFLETLSGKTINDARDDIGDCAGTLRYFAGLAEKLGEGVAVPQDADSPYGGELRKEPIGAVALVTPWNYPLLMSMWKVAPALAAARDRTSAWMSV